MLQELSMALTSLKTAKEMLKSNTALETKVSELNHIIVDLIDRYHSIQTAYTELQQQNLNLKAQISQFIKQKDKRSCYQRIKLPSGYFIYRYQKSIDEVIQDRGCIEARRNPAYERHHLDRLRRQISRR